MCDCSNKHSCLSSSAPFEVYSSNGVCHWQYLKRKVQPHVQEHNRIPAQRSTYWVNCQLQIQLYKASQVIRDQLGVPFVSHSFLSIFNYSAIIFFIIRHAAMHGWWLSCKSAESPQHPKFEKRKRRQLWTDLPFAESHCLGNPKTWTSLNRFTERLPCINYVTLLHTRQWPEWYSLPSPDSHAFICSSLNDEEEEEDEGKVTLRRPHQDLQECLPCYGSDLIHCIASESTTWEYWASQLC